MSKYFTFLIRIGLGDLLLLRLSVSCFRELSRNLEEDFNEFLRSSVDRKSRSLLRSVRSVVPLRSCSRRLEKNEKKIAKYFFFVK